MNCINEPIYRDTNVDCLDDFVKEMIKYAEKSKVKKTTLEEDESNYFETQWAKRHSLVHDYRHGNSQDSEEAYHTLNYLRKNYERYGKTWDI